MTTRTGSARYEGFGKDGKGHVSTQSGVLGNIIAPGGSGLLGTILGGAAGALAGREIDRSDSRCE